MTFNTEHVEHSKIFSAVKCFCNATMHTAVALFMDSAYNVTHSGSVIFATPSPRTRSAVKSMIAARGIYASSRFINVLSRNLPCLNSTPASQPKANLLCRPYICITSPDSIWLSIRDRIKYTEYMRSSSYLVEVDARLRREWRKHIFLFTGNTVKVWSSDRMSWLTLARVVNSPA